MQLLLSTLNAPQTQAHNLDTFIAERARVDLRILNDFGPRVTGSHANEVLAVDFLKREIAHIQTNAHPAQKIYADVQRVSGAYYADFRPHGFTSVYRDVQNVLAKLVGARERNGIGNETLLLNCHFDSVAGSPGASDDAASCAVMLEVLRLLAQSENVLQHSVLLLFNGAEETPLQASHGFVTQHAWATAVRAFLNLESAGSGGKEFLFQSGPEHAWLIDVSGELSKWGQMCVIFIDIDAMFRRFKEISCSHSVSSKFRCIKRALRIRRATSPAKRSFNPV